MGQTEVAVLTRINYRVKTTQPHSHAAHGAHSGGCENQEESDADSGRGLGREDTDVHLELIHAVVQQKRTAF